MRISDWSSDVCSSDLNRSTGLSGSSGALRIWMRVMKDLHVRSLDNIPPASVEEISIDPASGLRADEQCIDAISVPYLRNSGPQEWEPCAAQADQSGPMPWPIGRASCRERVCQ